MKIIKLFIFSITTATLFSGCVDRYDYDSCHEPIYLSFEKLRSEYPAIKEPREIKKAGKIYVYGDTLLINEKNKGIHIVDNRVKETPVRKKFIEIPGNIDMAIKDGFLYVDSYTDLVVLDIRDINNIKRVKSARKEDIFPYDYRQHVSKDDMDKDRCSGYDKKRGVIIGYE